MLIYFLLTFKINTVAGRPYNSPAKAYGTFGNVLGAPQRSPSPLRCSFTYFSCVFRRGKSNVAEAMDHI